MRPSTLHYKVFWAYVRRSIETTVNDAQHAKGYGVRSVTRHPSAGCNPEIFLFFYFYLGVVLATDLSLMNHFFPV